MSACRPRSERAGRWAGQAAGLALAALLASLLACAGPARAEAPARVVSINLCTDQLALMLAAPGQLVSVSRLAQDPRSSAMAEAAAALPGNSSLAEDVFLYRPDLVLAGSFTSRATVSMLRRLGVEVVELAPAYALTDVRDRLRTVGAALGREAQAAAAVARFDADLAALRAEIAERPRAALYYANGYTNGDRTLAGDIIAAAGFSNVATELGLVRGGHLALEQLVMATPDLVVTGQPHRGEARAEAVLRHPALAATGSRHAPTTDRDWICGTPHVLRAVQDMAAARRALQAETVPSSGRTR
jgi:iron complex transport system substrate-binding protein